MNFIQLLGKKGSLTSNEGTASAAAELRPKWWDYSLFVGASPGHCGVRLYYAQNSPTTRHFRALDAEECHPGSVGKLCLVCAHSPGGRSAGSVKGTVAVPGLVATPACAPREAPDAACCSEMSTERKATTKPRSQVAQQGWQRRWQFLVVSVLPQHLTLESVCASGTVGRNKELHLPPARPPPTTGER